jgi:hypothetical protein
LKEFVAMISEVFILEEDASWCIDLCATKHICKDRSLFKTFEIVEDGCVLFMGNSSTTVVKVLSLTNMYFVPETRKSLESGNLLNKFGFKFVFESDQFVLTKEGAFVGKGYLFEMMFKLNLINKVNNSAYSVDSISLWHNKLDHIRRKKRLV